MNIAIAIILPLLIASAVCAGFKKQMKTAVSQRKADNFMAKDGIHMIYREDRFVRKTETRAPLNKK